MAGETTEALRNATEQSSPSLAVTLLQAEYGALRSEVIERMHAERRLFELAVSALGVLLAASVQFAKPEIILVYPGLAAGLAAAWAADEEGTLLVGDYVNRYVEKRAAALSGTPCITWEDFFEEERNRGRRILHYRAAKIIFIGSQVLASLVGVLLAKVDVSAYIRGISNDKSIGQLVSVFNLLLLVSAASIVLTLFQLRFHTRRDKATKELKQRL